MSILSSIYRHTLARVLPTSPDVHNGNGNSRKRKFDDSEDKEPSSLRRKRESSDTEIEVITKRRRIDNDHFAPIVDGETYESTAISGLQLHHSDTATVRDMGPPPALNPSKIRSINKIIDENNKRRTSLDSADTASLISIDTRGVPQQRIPDGFTNEYDMQRAQRHAAATTLPPNSGVWECGEKELFFHLSYRGFEPLFPANWMRDFRTMPLSLYHQPSDESPPLIQHHKLGEFRAIRELRELLELGKNVRDQILSSPGVKREAIIERATNKYIAWAIRDVGIKLSSQSASRSRKSDAALPIHVVVKLRARQTTTDCLLEMKTKLHTLAASHRRARNIHASIERDQVGPSTPNSEGETREVESFEDDLPVLYGIMICKSVLAIFTLNSRTPPPSPPRSNLNQSSHNGRLYRSPSPSDSTFDNAKESVTSTEANLKMKRSLLLANAREREAEMEEDEYDSASDPRFISDFDFSDSAKDVWNALVIAIVAMQIRKDMVLFPESAAKPSTNEDVQRGIEEMDIDENGRDVDDDDPDA